jgi:hypothetical protein
MDKQQLAKLLQKAQGLEKNQALALAKEFSDLSEKIDNLKIPEPTDLTPVIDQLKNIEEKLEEDLIVELEII